MAIPFTQYLRPHGKKRLMTIRRSPDVEAMAKYLIGRGYKFDIEELLTGVISMTCELVGKSEELPVAIEQCQNGPPVLDAIDRLVKKSYEHCRALEGPKPIPTEPE